MPVENQSKNSRSSLILSHLIFSTLFFFIGFYTHSIIMTPPPGALVEQKQNMKDLQAKFTNEVENTQFTEIDLSTITSTFDGSSFIPSKITVPVGRRVSIVNGSSTQLMTLISENPILQTVRQYGESERLYEVMQETGVFYVYAKDKPGAVLEITVE